MPAIKDTLRNEVDPSIAQLDGVLQRLEPDDVWGTFVYVNTVLMCRIWERKKRFIAIALLLGCLLCAILEFYRMVVGPYEDGKYLDNGPVFPQDTNPGRCC